MSAKRKSTKKPASSKTKSKPAKAAKPARRAAAKKAPPPKRAAARKAPKKPSGPQIVHWEIQSQSPDKLHRFYSDVFGWSIDANNPMNYGMVASGGSDGINGGIGGSPQPGSRVLVYANVEDINGTLGKIESLGGRTLMPRTDLGMVIMAIYEDPEGNTMGIIEG